MDLLPTSEQQQIIDSTAAYISDKLPLQRLKALDRKPEVPAVDIWKEIAGLGWLGLGLEPSAGGVGYGPSEEVLLFREAGRAAVAPRMLFSVIAAHVAAGAGEVHTAQQIVAGELSSALAVRNVPLADGAPSAGCRLYECLGAQLAVAVEAVEATEFPTAFVATTVKV
jgi:alkylation response protein AidB-like acyl-CoA dehydrogenase